MISDEFKFAWPDSCDIQVKISWTVPTAHDLLFTDEIPENETAFFYSIVAYDKKVWLPYYIGMVFNQTVAARHKQPDHKIRLENLRSDFPKLQFLLTLGTPDFRVGKAAKEVIEKIEGLLIYANWHDEMVNKKKIQRFDTNKHIHIENSGWPKHLVSEIAYGVLYPTNVFNPMYSPNSTRSSGLR